MELRLDNQQRHSITAVLLSAVVVIFGLVIVDIVAGPEPDPLGARTEALDSSSTSTDVEASKAAEDLTAGVARSNARFTLNPDVNVIEVEVEPPTSMTTATTAVRRTTEASSASTTSISTPTSSTFKTTTTTELPAPNSSTSTTRVDPPGKPSTTVVDDETTTTKKCRANRPECRNP